MAQIGGGEDMSRASPARGGTTKQSLGRGAAYWRQRLEASRPDLLAQVRAGRLTAYGAATVAGWRRPSNSLPEIQRRIRSLPLDELAALFKWLLSHMKERGFR